MKLEEPEKVDYEFIDNHSHRTPQGKNLFGTGDVNMTQTVSNKKGALNKWNPQAEANLAALKHAAVNQPTYKQFLAYCKKKHLDPASLVYPGQDG